jgi:hypothetical protein
MLGIVFSLLAVLAALSLAFCPDDKPRRADSEWRASSHRLSKQIPANAGDAGNNIPVEKDPQ